MNPISFRIDVEPKSLQFSGRRERIVQPKRGGRAFIHHYKDPEALAYERACTVFCLPHRPASPLVGPVSLSVVFVLPRPQKYARAKDPEGRLWSTSRPDCTNLTKALEDILTAARFWHDDRQVAEQHIKRQWTHKGEATHMEVVIKSLTPPAPAKQPQGELFTKE